jgi:hypothetical protein
VGGRIYKFHVEHSDAEGQSYTVLNSLDDAKDEKVVNHVNNTSGKDVIVNHSAVSPNLKYSVVYTSTVLAQKFRDKMALVPYLGLAFTYWKVRDPEFYVREHTFTVFDEKGEVAWTKKYNMGEGDTAVYVESLNINNQGTVFIHGLASPIRFHYYDVKDKAIIGPKMKNRGPMRAHRIYSIRKNESIPYRLDYEEKDSDDKKISALYESFMFSGDRYLRVAAIQSGDKGLLGATNVLFAGFRVSNLNSHKVPSVLIPIDVYDLRNSLSDKKVKTLEKGKSIEIGYPIVHSAKLDAKSGLTLVINEYHYLDENKRKPASENLVILNTSLKGKVKSSQVHESKHYNAYSGDRRDGVLAFERNNKWYVLQDEVLSADAKKNDHKGLMLRQFDESGELEKETIFEGNRQHMGFGRSFVNGDGELILVGSRANITNGFGDTHFGDHPQKEKTAVGRLIIK